MLVNADKVDAVSKGIAESLGAKGGGRSGRYQGKAPHITQQQIAQAEKHMREHITTKPTRAARRHLCIAGEALQQ